MPLVINSLGGGHTHTYTNTHTDVHTGSIVTNQARAGLRPARTWFKNIDMVIWMYKKLQNTFEVQTFISCAINNTGIKENFCTNFFYLSLSCHQMEPPEAMANREGRQILKPVP